VVHNVEDKDLAFEEVNNLIRERCEKILEKFGQVAVSGVKNPKLFAALEDVKNYWRDFNRPSLTFFSCEAVGGTYEISQDAALMFTLASSGFGVHDDILDRSMNKHLRMTILGLHGVDTALLVGDLLIVKAWTFAHELIRKTGNPNKIADVLETYGNLSIEICEAEFMETQCRQKVDTDLEFYENILWKEVAEIEACSRIGAMMGDGKPSEIEALSDFGRRLGFLSRLADEVEDCLNVKDDLPHRIKYESIPLPLLYAAKSSSSKRNRIEKIVKKKEISTSDMKSLLKICFETDAFKYVNNLAWKKGEEAHHKLGVLKPSLSRTMLLAIIMQANARVKRLCI
jgi:geranylgeranyl diphosphate synthase type I